MGLHICFFNINVWSYVKIFQLDIWSWLCVLDIEMSTYPITCLLNTLRVIKGYSKLPFLPLVAMGLPLRRKKIECPKCKLNSRGALIMWFLLPTNEYILSLSKRKIWMKFDAYNKLDFVSFYMQKHNQSKFSSIVSKQWL